MSAEHSDARPITAYILIQTELGASEKIADRLAETVDGASIRLVQGKYSILLIVDAEGEEYVTRTLHDQIRPVDGVIDAEALISYEEGPTAPAQGQEFSAA